jgi:hypothetical protein
VLRTVDDRDSQCRSGTVLGVGLVPLITKEQSMSRRPLSLLAASLAVAVVAAPSALARPISDPPAAPAKSPAASQDRRTPDGIDRAQAAVQARGTNVAAPDQQDRRVASHAPTSSLAGTTSKKPLPGPPTWPVDPKPITAAQPAPVDGGGGGSPVLPAALILAGACVAMFAGMRFVRPRLRATRARV